MPDTDERHGFMQKLLFFISCPNLPCWSSSQRRRRRTARSQRVVFVVASWQMTQEVDYNTRSITSPLPPLCPTRISLMASPNWVYPSNGILGNVVWSSHVVLVQGASLVPLAGLALVHIVFICTYFLTKDRKSALLLSNVLHGSVYGQQRVYLFPERDRQPVFVVRIFFLFLIHLPLAIYNLNNFVNTSYFRW